MHVTPITADLLRGAAELEHTARGIIAHRLPARARAQCADPQLAMAESQPAGVRLAFRTRATTIELETRPTKRVYLGAPPRPEGVYEVLVDGRLTADARAEGGDTLTIDMATGATEHKAGPADVLRFDGLSERDKDVRIWLPHNETAELVGLRSDARLEPAGAARRTWLHHGSSISQGSNADRPTATWTALASLLGDVELINLGFSGGALLDPFTARTMAATAADVLSVKIGINVVNADLMRKRAFGPAVHGFLDTIREGHPDAPLLVVSALYCPIHEDTPGPGAFDTDALAAGQVRFKATGDPADVSGGKLTLIVVRQELERIVAERADPNLHYLDGRELYGETDNAELPLPDELHPDAATHRRIGERFAARVFAPGGVFGPPA